MIFVASRTGLRQGELISVRVHSLDFDNGWIRILTSYDRVAKNHKRPKGQMFRALPMSDEVKAVLRPHVEGKGPNDLVFGHPETGHELDGSKLLKRFKAAVIWAGVRREDWEKRTYRTSRGGPNSGGSRRFAFTICAMRSGRGAPCGASPTTSSNRGAAGPTRKRWTSTGTTDPLASSLTC